MKISRLPVGICLITILFSFELLPVCRADVIIPPHLDIEFKGELDDEQSRFLFILSNGSGVSIKDVTVKFSMASKNDKVYSVHISITGDNFFNETTLAGSITDGNLIIDSTRSIFKVSPNLLKQEGNIVLSEISDWKLEGEVIARTAKALTATPDKLVRATMVRAFHFIDDSSKRALILGYDPNTGVLVYAGATLTDILLTKIGIDYILGGKLKLVSFSPTLNLEIIDFPSNSNDGFSVILLIILPIIFLITFISFYRARKKGKHVRKSSGKPALNHKYALNYNKAADNNEFRSVR